jgi:hypothetical protein
VEIAELPIINNTNFLCIINGKKVIFDFFDGTDYIESDYPTFKFHYIEEHKNIKSLIPFSPISFYNWETAEKFMGMQYKITDKIICNQLQYGNAVLRRIYAQKVLVNKFKERVDVKVYPQEEFWRNCLNNMVSVLVPGYCNNMVDRVTMQLLALGSPFITTKLPEIFPFNHQLIEGNHYIKCSNDYKNVCSIIENISAEELTNISQNSKDFFMKTSHPKVLGEWILSNI